MAKQCGQVLFEGSVGNLTGYQQHGKFFLRQKGGVSRKRILTSARFELTRRNANWFAKAQKIASEFYRETWRLRAAGCRLTWYRLRNRAQVLVRMELPEQEIRTILLSEFIPPGKQNMAAARANNIQAVIDPRKEKEGSQEIVLGRFVNRELIPELNDRLVASRILVQSLLKNKRDIFHREREPHEFVLKKFRRW